MPPGWRKRTGEQSASRRNARVQTLAFDHTTEPFLLRTVSRGASRCESTMLKGRMGADEQTLITATAVSRSDAMGSPIST